MNASLLALQCAHHMTLVDGSPQSSMGMPGHTTASGKDLIPAASATELLRARPRSILETLRPLPRTHLYISCVFTRDP